MGRLTTLKPRVSSLNTSKVRTHKISDARITGTTLQARRFKAWKANPHCAKCGRLVEYPGGFELDHIVPLYKGGHDTEDNCQILCVYTDVVDGRLIKLGCHMDKTLDDGSQ